LASLSKLTPLLLVFLLPLVPVGEYWDALAYEWDGTPSPCQDAHRQRTVNWINAAGGLATAFDITLKGVLHAGERRLVYA
jgi:alpha-amylase